MSNFPTCVYVLYGSMSNIFLDRLCIQIVANLYSWSTIHAYHRRPMLTSQFGSYNLSILTECLVDVLICRDLRTMQLTGTLGSLVGCNSLQSM